MSDLSPTDRDLRLARHLDTGETGEPDAFGEALRTLRPSDPPPDPAASARVWAEIEGQIGGGAARSARDRAPVRLVGSAVRWAASAAVLLAVGVGVWMSSPRESVVAVAQAEIETFAAPDGSTITLRPHTQLVRLGERAYRVEGEAFFDVAHDTGRPFTVDAGAGTVRVLGTRFDVSTWGGRTEVFVDQGRVEVSAADAAVVLSAGDAAAVTEAGVVAVPDARAEAFLDWQRGQSVFDRQTVRRVADEIGQHLDVAISLPPDVAGQTVSGTVSLSGADQALGDLGRILGGRFEAVGAGYRFVP